MNDEDTNVNDPSDEGTAGAPGGVPTDRPLGYWLRTVDDLISRKFAAAFDGTGVTRREWMLLNALSGDLDLPAFADRFVRKGKRLRRLEDRGWIEQTGDGTWVLTDQGRAARERLGEIVEGVRSRVAGAVSPEDFATTLASLEAIARELGWDEGARMPRRGFGRGFGPGFAADHDSTESDRGFGPGSGRGFGFGPGFGFRGHGRGHHHGHHHRGNHGYGHGPDEHGHGHAHEHGYGPAHEHGHGPAHKHGHGHAHSHDHAHRCGGGHPHESEHAFERGFAAGYAASRNAAA
ncbi:MarR family winged helix-turn-helix transcriptional regulator [Microbacterium sp. zg.B48]|uniref:MarR family winged helix-turn-helix transcriptional regulator n=1 Tax=Microbacterium sp. zg.B48 TaxID=2969408 RepID=UPI00214C3415|nr:MarR family winged helix-turn-helix transcriptional regulator [Microbacterium sp. zg.B48]MCR2762835.1 MarR family winged helix-turn-helix transcriptional regulator [Microbacterium sp. zg.B48]